MILIREFRREKMLTALQGWESKADKQIILLLEQEFNLPVIHFEALQQPTEEGSGFWYFRMKGSDKPGFVRQNGIGEVFMYGPTKGKLLQFND